MAAMRNGGAWEYLLPDALGSVRQIVDANGNVTLAKSYEPYGSVLTSTGTASSIFGYAGEQIDTTGLIYLRARYYAQSIGRFLSVDTIIPDGKNPQQFNRYAYGLNNPVKYTDPSGHCIPGEPGCLYDENGNPRRSPRYPATLLDLRELGFEPGVDIDPLVYELYAHPESFEGYASVEYEYGISADLLAPPIHALISLFTGQGQIPDKYGEDELYSMEFALACDIDGGVRWTRYVVVDGNYQTLFDGTWKIGKYNGEPVGIETFHISDLVGDVQVMLKPRATAKKSLQWESVGILTSPNDRGEMLDLMKTPVVSPKILFETQQTSFMSIVSIGQLFINAQRVARVQMLGIYRGP